MSAAEVLCANVSSKVRDAKRDSASASLASAGRISRVSGISLARPRAVGHRPLRCRQHRRDLVGVADVEQHALRHLPGHLARRKIDDEQRLLAFDLADVGTFVFEAGENRTRVIAEIDAQTREFLRGGYVLDPSDGANADVDL